MSDHISTEDKDVSRSKARQLSIGNELLFNDLKRSITVTETHERQNSSRVQRQRGMAEYHTVTELEGNNPEYHIICTPSSDFAPRLYKEAD